MQLQSHAEPEPPKEMLEAAAFPAHSELFSSVDTTRVALRDVDESVPGSDYINANYIKVPGEGRAARGGCLHPAAGVGMQYWCKSGGSSVSGAICIPRVRVFLPYPQGISPFYQVLFALIQELISIPSFPYLLGRS